MITDLLLAIAHHLLVFSLFAMLAVELVWLKRDLGAAGFSRLAKLDMAYGIVAGLIVVVGIGRVFLGMKGWEYYASSHSFWAKMAAFVAIGLLSIQPTRKLLSWRRQAEKEPGFLPSEAEVRSVRRLLHLEAGIFLLILVFAAAMARGY